MRIENSVLSPISVAWSPGRFQKWRWSLIDLQQAGMGEKPLARWRPAHGLGHGGVQGIAKATGREIVEAGHAYSLPPGRRVEIFAILCYMTGETGIFKEDRMPASHTRNIVLTPQLDAYVGELLESGAYKSVSEVFRHGLRLVKKQRDHDEAQLAEIQTRIAIGLEQLKRGEGISGPPREVLGERLERFQQRRKGA